MSFTSLRGGPSTSAPPDSSRTITMRDIQSREQVEERVLESGEEVGSLQLIGGGRTRSPQGVMWSEDVVDNEGAGRKSSKICCIYHKPKRFDESSSEESSDSDSDSGSDASCDHRHPHRHGPRRHRPHRHSPDTNGDDANTRNRDGGEVVHELEENPDEPNKYEKVPRGKSKKGKVVNRNQA